VRRIGKVNKNLVVCPRNKQFKDLIVCAASCDKLCKQYIQNIRLSTLLEYVEEHPEYKLTGVIMAEKKIAASKTKKYWVLDSERKVVEVEESEILDNPQDYITKEIWDRPPYKYEVIIALKKVKV